MDKSAKAVAADSASAAISWRVTRLERFPSIMKPGQAKLVKAGSDIVLQMHYTANGKASHGYFQSRYRIRNREADRAGADAGRRQSAIRHSSRRFRIIRWMPRSLFRTTPH